MTNMFDVALERRERERLERESKKPDMVDVIADKLLEDHMVLMAENKRLRDALESCASMVESISNDYVVAATAAAAIRALKDKP